MRKPLIYSWKYIYIGMSLSYICMYNVHCTWCTIHPRLVDLCTIICCVCAWVRRTSFCDPPKLAFKFSFKQLLVQTRETVYVYIMRLCVYGHIQIEFIDSTKHKKITKKPFTLYILNNHLKTFKILKVLAATKIWNHFLHYFF